MNDAKYIGLDVHQATISAAVLDSAGNLVMEAILETKTETILQFLRGIHGSLHVTFEEGTWAAWLHDLLKPYVTRVVVCDTRKTGLGKHQNRNDREDARGLARLVPRRSEIGLSRRERSSDIARTGTHVPDDHAGPHQGDDTRKSDLPELGNPLCRPAGLCAAAPERMAGETRGRRRAPPGGILLPAV